MQFKVSDIDAAIAARFVQLVLNCINQEYPHSNIFWFDSDEDIKPPRELTPTFYGCLDWHSAVHGHWLLVRLCRYFPEAQFQEPARQALNQSLTTEKIQGEIAHLKRFPFFECPYGFAWLLQLVMELREWDDDPVKPWLMVLEPLEALVAANFQRWLQSLEFPDRTGAHFNTAFPLSLAWDWTQITQNEHFSDLIRTKAQRFYLDDRNYPLHIEPLAYDTISPGLAEADLMRRILAPTQFTDWFTDFLPQTTDLWEPMQITNPKDYMQSHFRGLNLSRAWMMEGIIPSLSDDSRIDVLQAAAALHRHFGLIDAVSDHYSSSHWLGTFAVYLMTSRGLVLS